MVQENKGSPKERVFTLPSISEDEEVSDSDEELKLNEKQRDEDDDDDSQASSHLMSPSASVSSPLLSKLGKLPNGDIDVFNRYFAGLILCMLGNMSCYVVGCWVFSRLT